MEIETDYQPVEVAAVEETPQQSGAYVMKKCCVCGKPFAVARKIASFTKRCPDCRLSWNPVAHLRKLDRRAQAEARRQRNANLAELDKRCPAAPSTVQVIDGWVVERRGKVPVGAYAVSTILHS